MDTLVDKIDSSPSMFGCEKYDEF